MWRSGRGHYHCHEAGNRGDSSLMRWRGPAETGDDPARNEKGACLRKPLQMVGSDTWIRTRDPLINSHAGQVPSVPGEIITTRENAALQPHLGLIGFPRIPVEFPYTDDMGDDMEIR